MFVFCCLFYIIVNEHWHLLHQNLSSSPIPIVHRNLDGIMFRYQLILTLFFSVKKSCWHYKEYKSKFLLELISNWFIWLGISHSDCYLLIEVNHWSSTQLQNLQLSQLEVSWISSDVNSFHELFVSLSIYINLFQSRHSSYSGQ